MVLCPHRWPSKSFIIEDPKLPKESILVKDVFDDKAETESDIDNDKTKDNTLEIGELSKYEATI